MNEEYERRYKLKFFVFNNIIDIEQYRCAVNQYSEDKVFVYTGVLDYNINTLVNFASALEELQKGGLKVKFRLYTKLNNSNFVNKLNRFNFVELNEYVPQDEIPFILSKANYLLLPLPFDGTQKFTNLSLPTKLPEYFASKAPIIAITPKNTALYNYLNDNNAAYLIDSDDKKVLLSKLKKLITDSDSINLKVDNAYKLLLNRHNLITEESRFISLISEN